MNSIIEAQITLEEEQRKELERCKTDIVYYFENYLLFNGKPRKLWDYEKERLRNFKNKKDLLVHRLTL